MFSFILFFFVMVIVIGGIAVGGFSFYLKRRAKRLRGENQPQIVQPPYRSLFEPTAEEVKSFQQEENAKITAGRRAILRQNLTERANDDDFQVLSETKTADDLALYYELLEVLTGSAGTESEKIVNLMDFISKNELPTSELLAENVLTVWKNNPSLTSLAKVLHISALSDSAEVYSKMINAMIAARREKKLSISGNDLYQLFESHYWLLSNEARTSGKGFLLKEKLANMRDELIGDTDN